MRRRRTQPNTIFMWCTVCDVGYEHGKNTAADRENRWGSAHSEHLVQMASGLEFHLPCPNDGRPLFLTRQDTAVLDYKCLTCGHEVRT